MIMKQYPYQITYKLHSTGNKRLKENVQGACASEARKIFEASKPSATVLTTTPLPQN